MGGRIVRKRLLVVGMIILLIVWLNGCISKGKEISLAELSAHPSKYLGKEIIVKGTIIPMEPFGAINDEEGHMFYATFSEDFKGQIPFGEYKFRGIVKQGLYEGDDTYYLEIIDAYDPDEIFIPGFEFVVFLMAIAGAIALKGTKEK